MQSASQLITWCVNCLPACMVIVMESMKLDGQTGRYCKSFNRYEEFGNTGVQRMENVMYKSGSIL